MTSIQMPQLGETIIEGTILKWLKQEGDAIDRDEPLFEISTDKVDTEVPSPVAGTVTKILVQEGQTVAVGTELAEIDSGTELGSARRRRSPRRRPPQRETPEPAPAERRPPPRHRGPPPPRHPRPHLARAVPAGAQAGRRARS